MNAPSPGEYGSAFAGYVIKANSVTDPVAALASQLDELHTLLRPLNAEQWRHRYAPDKWSLQELLGHITDTERIFAYRALRIGRGDTTPLPGFDQDPYVLAAEADRCDPTALLSEFIYVRQSTIAMCRTFPEAAWSRSGTVGNGPMTTRAMIFITYGHAAHHLEIVRERYHVR
jgi:hypothetical protein